MSDRPRKVLLTGASGFIGSHLLQLLLARGFSVTCVVRDPSKLPASVTSAAQLTVIKGDLHHEDTLLRLPQNADCLIHLAALLGDAEVSEEEILRSNLELTERLSAWFQQTAGRQFLLVSTPGVQGLGHRAAAESAAYNPHGTYERAKMLAEQSLQKADWPSGQNWTILRPDFVYGPGDVRRIRLYRQIQRRRWIKVGRGKAVVRPTYVEDVCVAILTCLDNSAAFGRVFNVAGPKPVTIDHFVELIARLLNVRLLPLRLPTPVFRCAAAGFELCSHWFGKKPLFTRSQVDFLSLDHGTDISLIEEHLGFRPETDLEEGLRRTIQWANEAGLL